MLFQSNLFRLILSAFHPNQTNETESMHTSSRPAHLSVTSVPSYAGPDTIDQSINHPRQPSRLLYVIGV